MPGFHGFGADLRFTGRLFRKSPGFSLVAILSMALGIGASSAIFSLIYAVLLDPYPYKDPVRIIAPAFDKRGQQGRMFFRIQDFIEIRRNSKTIEDMFLADEVPFVATRGLPEQVRGDGFSPNGFDFMGVPAMMGRTFTERDIAEPAAPPRIAVISYLFWLKHFNRDPQAIGQELELNHQNWTVIGILPPRFTWNDADIYVPLAMAAGPRVIPTMMRVRPGYSLDAVNTELQAVTERIAHTAPDTYPKEFRFRVLRLNEWLLGKFQGTLLILMAAVGFLLLIACGNVSILLLARAGARQKEIAVRVALGSGRGRVIRQLLTESVLLSLTGGVLGIALAWIGVPLLVALMPQYSVPHEAAIQVNTAVVAFTFGIAVLTGILFGMAPAMQLAKADVREAMQETGRAVAGSTRAGKTRSALIVIEVALTMVLLVGAGVAIRGFVALMNAPLGFDPKDVLIAQMNMPRNVYKTWDARSRHWLRLLDGFQSTPGVIAAAATLTAMPPYIGFGTPIEVPGWPNDPNGKVQVGLVGGDYFGALHIPLLRGRSFSRDELARTRRLGVINDLMARQYWPGGNPLGVKVRIPQLDYKDDQIRLPPDAAEPIEIIGVVATARNRGLGDPPRPAIYVPWTVVAGESAAFLVRTQGDPHAMVNSFRERLRAVDPDQPLVQVATLEENMASFSTAYPRFSTTLFSIFAGVGLLLAASGLYSVVSFVVSRRTHEFGIRMALGANAGDVLRLVVWMTGRLLIAGVLIGLGGSLALSKVIANYVQGWNPKDPVAFGAVVGALILTALAASWLPARRSIRIQPMSALRHE